MKVLVAPDKFKGSLSAVAAAEAIARGFLSAWPEAEVQIAPIADGGEGFAEALCVALDGEWIATTACDPLGRKVDARYVWVASRKLAIIEMSEASGLWRLKPAERDPLHASTFGTGQLMRDATARGARTILVGLGGSATTDGGIGMAEALGYEFLNGNGESVGPGDLRELRQIRTSNALVLPQVIAACDVQNPLLGERGTAFVFSPQKGADARTVRLLEQCMENLARIVTQELGCDFREAEGAGAAGGIGFGLMSFCGAKIQSGFDVVADALQLAQRIAASDLVITGEGRLDGQTLEGKGPAGVAALARKNGKPVIALAGSVATDGGLDSLFNAACPIVDQPVSLEEAMQRGAEFLERTARRAAQLIQLGTVL
ncbi:MAG: Glycerate kinase [Chthoniobacteraceae bacterium]|nr:Glycerate kinase [Chthoniobacteraceae bacterium]